MKTNNHNSAAAEDVVVDDGDDSNKSKCADCRLWIDRYGESKWK